MMDEAKVEQSDRDAAQSLDETKVYKEARDRYLNDATQQGFEHHLIRVAGEMAAANYRMFSTPTLPGREIEQAAKIAECAFDDRPRSRVGHPSYTDWEDGYREGTQAAAAAIRAALAATPDRQAEEPSMQYRPSGLKWAAVDQHDLWQLIFADPDCRDQWFGGADYEPGEARKLAIEAWDKYAPAWSVRLMRTVTFDEIADRQAEDRLAETMRVASPVDYREWLAAHSPDAGDGMVLADVAKRLRRLRSGELTGEGCKHGFDRAVCPSRECADDEDALIEQLIAAHTDKGSEG